MIDMRYHAISLVAVFVALAIGMLIGTSLVERGLIVEQKAQIKSLRRTFDEIKAKNASLHDELTAHLRFGDEARPYLVTNMLAGRSFALITGENFDENAVKKILEGVGAAGGAIPITINISDSKAFSDQTVASKLEALFQAPAGAQDLKERVFTEIVNQLQTAANTAILSTLEQLGVIHVIGVLAAPVSGAVLLGPVESQSLDKTDTPLVKTFTSRVFPLVAVVGSDTEQSVVTVYKKNGVSTVDHVDTVPGEVALDMALAGKPGNFGSGGAASRMLPAP
ncbi:MAG: hypothetical protein CVT63_04165 [Candidatus Anoxymicrobium japonicum]|uniref:Copper transporter n=1 Tax=Candidatus Anoxymicrobium japonicum TaxID=2013648 RepID=A0A2N3G624_9ACTN|nr:MAG: hypothetical protein CVT63_04165 [Candidatus Anoxymicrobium japonicum]